MRTTPPPTATVPPTATASPTVTVQRTGTVPHRATVPPTATVLRTGMLPPRDTRIVPSTATDQIAARTARDVIADGPTVTGRVTVIDTAMATLHPVTDTYTGRLPPSFRSV